MASSIDSKKTKKRRWESEMGIRFVLDLIFCAGLCVCVCVWTSCRLDNYMAISDVHATLSESLETIKLSEGNDIFEFSTMTDYETDGDEDEVFMEEEDDFVVDEYIDDEGTSSGKLTSGGEVDVPKCPTAQQADLCTMGTESIEQEDLPCANTPQAALACNVKEEEKAKTTSIQPEQPQWEELKETELTENQKLELLEEVLSSILGKNCNKKLNKGEWQRLAEGLQRADEDQLDKLRRASWNINLGLCNWVRPRKGFFRVDIDGSINAAYRKKDGAYKLKKGGFGAIVRDNSCTAIVAAAGVSSPVSVVYHQLEGVKRGLELAKKHGCHNVRVCTNQVFVVRLLTDLCEPLEEDREWVEPILDTIRNMSYEFEYFAIDDVGKESNRAADYLSKLYKEIEMKGDELDEELKGIIAEDTKCKMVFEC